MATVRIHFRPLRTKERLQHDTSLSNAVRDARAGEAGQIQGQAPGRQAGETRRYRTPLRDAAPSAIWNSISLQTRARTMWFGTIASVLPDAARIFSQELFRSGGAVQRRVQSALALRPAWAGLWHGSGRFRSSPSLPNRLASKRYRPLLNARLTPLPRWACQLALACLLTSSRSEPTFRQS